MRILFALFAIPMIAAQAVAQTDKVNARAKTLFFPDFQIEQNVSNSLKAYEPFRNTFFKLGQMNACKVYTNAWTRTAHVNLINAEAAYQAAILATVPKDVLLDQKYGFLDAGLATRYGPQIQSLIKNGSAMVAIQAMVTDIWEDMDAAATTSKSAPIDETQRKEIDAMLNSGESLCEFSLPQ